MLPYAKAIVSAIIAGLTALGTALLDGHVTPSEGVAIALAFFVALSGTYMTPNKKAAAAVRPPEPPTTTTPVASAQ